MITFTKVKFLRSIEISHLPSTTYFKPRSSTNKLRTRKSCRKRSQKSLMPVTNRDHSFWDLIWVMLIFNLHRGWSVALESLSLIVLGQILNLEVDGVGGWKLSRPTSTSRIPLALTISTSIATNDTHKIVLEPRNLPMRSMEVMVCPNTCRAFVYLFFPFCTDTNNGGWRLFS